MVDKEYVEGLKSHIEYLKETKQLWRQQAYTLLNELVELKTQLEKQHDTGSQSQKESR
jgi:hypothetical protein